MGENVGENVGGVSEMAGGENSVSEVEVNIPDFSDLRSAVESKNRVETWKILRKINYSISFNRYKQVTLDDIYHVLNSLDKASTVFTRPEDVTLLDEINTVLVTISRWFELYRESMWVSLYRNSMQMTLLKGSDRGTDFKNAAQTYNRVQKKLEELSIRLKTAKERGGWFLAG